MRDFGILSPNPIFLHTILARLLFFFSYTAFEKFPCFLTEARFLRREIYARSPVVSTNQPRVGERILLFSPLLFPLSSSTFFPFLFFLLLLKFKKERKWPFALMEPDTLSRGGETAAGLQSKDNRGEKGEWGKKGGKERAKRTRREREWRGRKEKGEGEEEEEEGGGRRRR